MQTALALDGTRKTDGSIEYPTNTKIKNDLVARLVGITPGGQPVLTDFGLAGPAGSAEAMAQLVEIMREQHRAREGGFGRELYRGGLARRLYDDPTIAEASERVRGTTHVSVVDERGNAASLTASTGSG